MPWFVCDGALGLQLGRYVNSLRKRLRLQRDTFTLDTAGAELQEGSTGVFSAGQRRRRQSELSVCVVSAGFKDETCPPVSVPHSTQKGFSAACNAGRDDNFESFESAPPGYRIQK